ncbi:MAG: hypothetical protein ACRC6T_01635 [Sarcina sp.]
MSKNSEKHINSSSDYIGEFDMVCSDGIYFYLVCENMNCISVVKENSDFIKHIMVPFGIYKIAYDCVNNVFLCICSADNKNIIIVNKKGNVCESLDISEYIEGCCVDIAFDEKSNCIIILDDKNKIYVIDKHGHLIRCEKISGISCISSIKMCNGYIFIYSKGRVHAYDFCYGLIGFVNIINCEGTGFLVKKTDECTYSILIITGNICNIKLKKYKLIIEEKNEICDDCDCDCHDSEYDSLKPSKGNCRSVFDIIESIALQEAGLSHIINAEGEKIQKAVAICKNCDELIKVNDSVKGTLGKVIECEIMLNSKLKTIQEIIEKLDMKCYEDRPHYCKECVDKNCDKYNKDFDFDYYR